MNMGNNDQIIYGELVKSGWGDLGSKVVTIFVSTTAEVKEGITYLAVSREPDSKDATTKKATTKKTTTKKATEKVTAKKVTMKVTMKVTTIPDVPNMDPEHLYSFGKGMKQGIPFMGRQVWDT